MLVPSSWFKMIAASPCAAPHRARTLAEPERILYMPKYLIQASYTADGLKGLAKDTASGRKAAVTAAMKAVKGKVEAFYFAFGSDDAVILVDAPDNVAAAAISLSASSSGLVNLRTTPLLTAAEVDQALALPSKYRAPGQ
jgi:uncharacterized protein with GYD domain